MKYKCTSNVMIKYKRGKCFRILVIEINNVNVAQTYSDEKIMIMSIHSSETVNSNKLDKHFVNISWSKVNTQ